MAKEILVKTPLTTNGSDPVLGADGKQVYSESTLGFAAKAVLEKRNTTLPQHLKVIITEIEEPAAKPKVVKEPA